MNELDDIDVLAGEYVLGTLDAGERSAVAARREREPALDRAISRWERDFAPLMEAAPPITPPADLFQRIEKQLAVPEVRPDANVVALRRKVRLWRNAAVVASALAASLVLVVVWQGMTGVTADSRYVAVLQKDSTSPAFLVTVDLSSKTLAVKQLTNPAAPNKSYELWLINAKLGDPRSLGVITAPLTISEKLRSYDPEIVAGSAVAVSLEPAGGSPTGKVTGPVLYSGPLLNTPL